MRPHRAVVAVAFLGVVLASADLRAATKSSTSSSSKSSSSSSASSKIQSASELMSKYAPSTGSDGLTNFAETMSGSGSFVGADLEDRGVFIGRGANLDATDSTTSQSSSSRSSSSRYGTSTSRNRYGNSTSRYGQSGSSRYGQSGSNRSGQTTASFLPTVRLGFDCPPPKDLSARLTTQLQQTTRANIPKSIQLDCNEGVAVLRGTVATDHERALLEQLIALEPGVRRIDNQITVVPPAAASAPATP